MSCHICTRSHSSRLRFLCPTCARNQLYQLRVDNASVLLERESLGRQIEVAVKSNEATGYGKDPVGLKDGGCGVWALQNVENMQAESSGRIKIIANEIESLGSAIKNKKFEISQRKLELARRRSDSESARYQLAEREGAMLASTQNNIKRTDHLWHSLHSKTAEARIFLCREAASLYGLRQKVRRRDNVTEETYVIGGVSIIELRNLNGKSRLISIHLSTSANTQAGASPDHISTLFSYIAHLLVLVSHYLSLRLPAEITLPHRNYPTPTIYTPSASYLPREAYSVSFPSQSLGSSPTSSRTADSRPPPHRPRPLSIDKTLPKLAREDPSTYALFLEGVTLLAWNVSWLCRSQGLNLASDSWEDICDIGKNMWQLLVAPPAQPSSLIRALTAHDLQTKIKKTPKDSPKTTIQRTKSFPMLGHYSHGTAHSFLGASEGTEFIRSWKLPTPTKVVDKLKSTLLGEMASAEWELLEEKEWDDAVQEPTQAVPQEPVNVSDPTSDNKPRVGGAGSIISQPATLDSANSPARSKGTSGWTKLRNR